MVNSPMATPLLCERFSYVYQCACTCCGLPQVGDEVIRINGLILSESTHEEVVSIMTHKKSLTLTVKCVGMIPVQE